MRRIVFAGLTGLICILAADWHSIKTYAQSKSIASSSSSEISTVKFCDVIRNPEFYDGKTIRIQVTWFSNFEWVWLYAPGLDTCDSQKNFIRPDLDCLNDVACKEMQEILNKNLEGDPFDGMRAELVLVGRFRYRKEPLSNGEGQNGTWYYKLGITRIEAANKIPEKGNDKSKP